MLPRAERLAPYLKSIDSARIYSNFGPMVRAFEARLADRCGLPDGTVTSVANATLGLALALDVHDPLPGALCVMPAWTFVASPHAATMAGLVPWFVDADPVTWALDPEAIEVLIEPMIPKIGAVMPVAPFGRPIDVRAWERFRARTGVPVVIDAAAGFDSIVPGSVPAVVSLHATKVLGVGEGGFIVSDDAALIRRIRTRSNFGFSGSREAVVSATNAKMSEFHAAIGLAALDEWVLARGEWMAAATAYRDAAADLEEIEFQAGFGQSWITSTCVVRIAGSGALGVSAALARAGIETRRWWGDGAHAHQATHDFPRTALPATEALARSTIALPFFRDIEAGAIDRVLACVREASRTVVTTD